MRKVECLKYCQFLHDGCSDVELASILHYWNEICIRESCAWIITVVTQAAGRGGGKNIDIYKFNPDICKEDLCELLLERDIKETIIIFNCFNESLDVFINKIVQL